MAERPIKIIQSATAGRSSQEHKAGLGRLGFFSMGAEEREGQVNQLWA